MSRFINRMDSETFELFWAALQRGAFITVTRPSRSAHIANRDRAGSPLAAGCVRAAVVI
ncbi:MAG: hypothetical protein QOD83_992 [Solirubrobacteraceae bacterium]|jgi:hypothetical protein|nr:hypothetical protein [Solirubrobacteraceae bacterium]